MPDLYQRDIRPCLLCGEGLMHTGIPLAYRITIEHLGFNAGAIQRQHGSEQMLGGNAAIAHAMGMQEAMAKSITTVTGLVCHQCALERNLPIAAVAEFAQPKDEESAE